MSSLFDKFDQAFLNDDLLNSIEEAEKNEGQGEYAEVPVGRYEVKIEKMELKESSKGDPMFTCWFRIVNGAFQNQMIFMNQVIKAENPKACGFQISKIKDFLRSLKSVHTVAFVTFNQFGELIEDVFRDVNGRLEYGLEYSENKKNPQFKEYKIFADFPAQQA